MTSVEVENSHSFSEKEQSEAKKQKIDKPFTIFPFGKYKGVSIEDVSKLTEIKNGKVINTGKKLFTMD